MTWLNEWIKEVIMIVLLATFVDLILPSRSMERYVKLVLSLLILLTLLQPIISLFTDSPEMKLSAAFQNQDTNAAQFTNGKETTLQQILSQGEKIEHQQQGQSLLWAGEEVARQMKQQIEEKISKQVQEVKVALELPSTNEVNEPESPYIISVDVVLQLEVEDELGKLDDRQDQELSTPIAITPIAPVKVEVDMKPIDSKNSYSEDDRSVNNSSVEGLTQQIEGAEDIQQLLSNEWNLKTEQIRVLVVGDSKV
ncbi:stage III sporulation protein AF [Paenibacillus crassostreae]|uniref:Stage III sporulation protein AF n=1 Tax=Paenibacillus crassostreae TaxID=1763538 RepID=A0A167DHH3_9BACL|nr:stage III sporulation protein AF [Paenibacillus crassostreae]AOZ91463.1 stage III sporulation protein AF [Paenibacillus crassostreae]OAB74378.1 hypothetical protein PNBC_09895 [Paenibacillus crassostreae]